ncbi:MAG: hypothetical protein P8Z70_08495 [Desulfuromonadales bacterium]
MGKPFNRPSLPGRFGSLLGILLVIAFLLAIIEGPSRSRVGRVSTRSTLSLDLFAAAGAFQLWEHPVEYAHGSPATLPGLASARGWPLVQMLTSLKGAVHLTVAPVPASFLSRPPPV